MDKFQNKYRIPSARAPFWDYGWNASYFVTICTYHQNCYFGDIVNEEMVLSDIGEIAQQCWLQIPEHFPFVKLDVFIIMPNHVHGIVIIDKNDDGRNDEPSSKNKFGPQSKNLPSIIRGFKIGVTKNARMINKDFAWQAKYYDHIIRNDKSYNNISEYIENNPITWGKDKFYVE